MLAFVFCEWTLLHSDDQLDFWCCSGEKDSFLFVWNIGIGSTCTFFTYVLYLLPLTSPYSSPMSLCPLYHVGIVSHIMIDSYFSRLADHQLPAIALPPQSRRTGLTRKGGFPPPNYRQLIVKGEGGMPAALCRCPLSTGRDTLAATPMNNTLEQRIKHTSRHRKSSVTHFARLFALSWSRAASTPLHAFWTIRMNS